MTGDFEFSGAFRGAGKLAQIYLQCIGLLRGDEEKARVLADTILNTDNPHYWLMVCFGIGEYDEMIAVIKERSS